MKFSGTLFSSVPPPTTFSSSSFSLPRSPLFFSPPFFSFQTDNPILWKLKGGRIRGGEEKVHTRSPPLFPAILLPHTEPRKKLEERDLSHFSAEAQNGGEVMALRF